MATHLISLGWRFQGVVAASNDALDVRLPWRIEAGFVVWGKAILTQGEEGIGNGLFLGYRCVLLVLEDNDVCYGCHGVQERVWLVVQPAHHSIGKYTARHC